MHNKHALVLGASGITGWAIVNELLGGSPDAQCFTKPQNSKLLTLSGIDLLKGSLDDLKIAFRKGVPDISTVSHVFFNSYKFSADNVKQSEENAAMLERAITVIEALSTAFEFVVLPTGGKTYGFHLLDNFPFREQLPLKETLPRIPEPYATELFYYWQVDRLKQISEGKNWTYCEIRPDMVVGFVPNNNAHCLAQTLAIYLSLFVHINGKGSTIPFPGNEKSWATLSNDSSQDIVARFSIYAALRPEKAGQGRAFNVADRDRPSSWSIKWPIICSLFGLNGTGPAKDAYQPGQYIQEHRDKWTELTQVHQLRLESLDNELANPKFQHYIMSLFTFDRVISLEASCDIGFSEAFDEKTSWFCAFQRFRQARIIP